MLVSVEQGHELLEEPALPSSRLLRESITTCLFFFFSSRRRHTRLQGDWSSDVCSSDLTALLADPTTGNIYISEHDGHVVSVFNPLLKTFREYPSLDPNGLPFGMAIDAYGNLWVAEHTINKIAVINPTTGESTEVNIPTQSSFVQWLTSDSKGNIWLAEQRGNSLAVTTSTAKLAQPNSPVSQTSNNNNNNNQPGVPKLGFSYADVVGPSLTGGIIVSALFYTKSIMDL